VRAFRASDYGVWVGPAGQDWQWILWTRPAHFKISSRPARTRAQSVPDEFGSPASIQPGI